MLQLAAATAAAASSSATSRCRVQLARASTSLRERRWSSTHLRGTDHVVEVVFPGSPGSLSNIGAKEFFRGSNANLTGVGSFARTFEAVSKGEATYGVVPIENSSSGTVHQTYDLLLQHDVAIAGDLGIHEKYCLCVKPDADLATIRSVTSHPVILSACSEFISQKLKPGQDLVASKTTCEAATSVGSSDRSHTAAIATHEAAALHGLKVVATDIGNDVFMETRYILICKSTDASSSWSMPTHLQTIAARKQSSCFGLNNEAGSLFKLLSCWALRGIDVVKVESRPHSAQAPSGHGATKLWDQTYYIDHLVPETQTEDEARQLWAALCEFSSWQRGFGTYSSIVSRKEKKAKTWDQMYQTMTWG